MKKGIIMELHQKYTIVMTEEGSFQKAIPIKDANVGAEVVYQPLKQKGALFLFYPRRRLSQSLHLFTLVCIVLLFIFPFYFLIGDEETYAYVNVDINPSIELEIDKAFNVNRMEPLNKDALGVVDGLANYQHKDIETVIEMIVQESEAMGLVNEGKHMLVGVSYATGEQGKDATVLDHIKSYFNKENPSWEIAAFLVPGKIREKAKKSNKSMNEVMATTIMETENNTNDQQNVIDLLDEKDKAIINSFYNTDHQTKPEKTNNKKKPDIDNQSLKIKEKSPKQVKEPRKEIKPSKKADDKHKSKKLDKNNQVLEHKKQRKGPPKKKHLKDNGKHNGNKKGKNKDNHKDKIVYKEKSNNKKNYTNEKNDKSNHNHKQYDNHKQHDKHKKYEKNYNNKHKKHQNGNHNQKSNHK